jgi:hypothetical protein
MEQHKEGIMHEIFIYEPTEIVEEYPEELDTYYKFEDVNALYEIDQ